MEEVKSSIKIQDGVITKTLVSDHPVWVEKFQTEKQCYLHFKEQPIDILTPTIIDTNNNSMRLVYIEGKELCSDRYIEEQLDANIMKDIISNILKANNYQTNFVAALNYKEKIEKRFKQGFISEELKGKLLKILPSLEVKQFNHGDMLLKNIIKTTKGELAFIDWEFAGLYIKGYDFALLHTTLAEDKKSQQIIEETIKELEIEKEFWFNKTLITAREIKIHDELEDLLPFKQKRISLLKKEEILCVQYIDNFL